MAEDEGTSKHAICFTAGVSGAPFAAGVIHAHLAADRDPPAVCAGISMGALSAAAMQRAYLELEEERAKARGVHHLENARWSWLRKYFSALSERPLDVIWDGIPDVGDFF